MDQVTLYSPKEHMILVVLVCIFSHDISYCEVLKLITNSFILTKCGDLELDVINNIPLMYGSL